MTIDRMRTLVEPSMQDAETGSTVMPLIYLNKNLKS